MSTLIEFDPHDMTARYNTELSQEDEQKFQEWAKEQGRQNDVYDYDLRGAWRELTSGEMTEADNGHLGDRYKKPNHPTFSDQSAYHGTDGHYGGSWSEDSKGNVTFTPSETNLRNMSPDELKEYFDKVEPGVKLNIPESIAEKLYPLQGQD